MIITAKWIGTGTEQDPYSVELPVKYAGRGWSIIPNQAPPQVGASVQVKVF